MNEEIEKLKKERDEARNHLTRLENMGREGGICIVSREYIDGITAERDRLRARVAELEKLEATVNESLTVDLDGMIAACIPGGDTCDPQEVADAIREWHANHIVDANKKVPDAVIKELYGEPQTQIQYGPSKVGGLFRGGAPNEDGWIPHRPGDPMPCDGNLEVYFRCKDEFESRLDFPARDFAEGAGGNWWTGENANPGDQIIAWKPAK